MDDNKCRGRYEALPPLEPFHALFRAIKLIENKNTRARKSELVGISVFFIMHVFAFPYILFCYGLVNIIHKLGWNFKVSAWLIALFILFYFIIYIALRMAKDSCCYRRFCDLGKDEPDEMEYTRNGCFGRLIIGNVVPSFAEGDKGENFYGKSPKYVYVDSHEAEGEYTKRYNHTLVREFATFIIGITCVASFIYFAFYWGGIKSEQSVNYQESTARVQDVIIEPKDVLGTWEGLKGNDTVIFEIKESNGKVFMKIDGATTFRLDGILIDNPHYNSSNSYQKYNLKITDYKYCLATENGDEIHQIDSKGPAEYVEADNLLKSCDELKFDIRCYLNLSCNEDTSVLRIMGKELIKSYYIDKKEVVNENLREEIISVNQLKRKE